MKLTNEQEEIVRQYVEAQELKLKTLNEDIIDHICCVLESELRKGKSFDKTLHNAIVELAPNGLLDLERQTFFLLNHKRIIIMKKLLFIISCLISTTVGLGFIAKLLHLPGAGELLTTSYVLILVLVPLFAFERYKVAIAKALPEKLTVIFGATALMLYFIGGLVKIIHTPGAGFFLGLATASFFIALPLLFFTMYKRSVS